MNHLINDINVEDLVEQGLLRVEELLKNQQLEEAEMVVSQILKVDSDSIKAMQLYGLTLYAKKKYQEAIDVLVQAIMMDDLNAENYNNLSLCYLQINQGHQALEIQKKAVDLKPNNSNFLNNLAIIYRSVGNYEEAIKVFNQSLEIDPNNAKTLESLGSTYGQSKQIEKAIETFLKATEIDPTNTGVHVDLAYGHHLLGQWEKAWPHYEYRLEHWHKTNRASGIFYEMFTREKVWDGKESLENKKIIVYCEQGIGDYINFVRFIPLLTKKGATVYLECPENLAILFSDFGNITTVRTNTEYDYHCSVLSLPYLLGLTPEEYLGEKPYLNVTEKFDMSDYDGMFKIGIVWAGNPAHPNDVLRSCHLNRFRNISQIPNVKLFSLQKDNRKRTYAKAPDVAVDLAENCDDMKVVDMSNYMSDFCETSKIINSLDLIITVDTSVLHLAGALGKETWALIAFNPDWRWTLNGNKTIWYDSVTLFRQEEFNNWDHPFLEIENKLKERLIK